MVAPSIDGQPLRLAATPARPLSAITVRGFCASIAARGAWGEHASPYGANSAPVTAEKGPFFKENGRAWRMARIVLPVQQRHDEENGGKKVCDEGSQTGEIASERLCLNGAFIIERPRPNRGRFRKLRWSRPGAWSQFLKCPFILGFRCVTLKKHSLHR